MNTQIPMSVTTKTGDLLDNLTFKSADNRHDLEQAFRLVYDCYVQKGYINQNASRLQMKAHHFVPGAAVFVGKLGEKVVATSSVFADSRLRLPADSLFLTELDMLRTQGRKIAELGALASNLEMGNSTIDVPFHILQAVRIVYLYARDVLQVDDMIITVNPRHKSFYERALLFEPMSDVRCYQAVNGAPAIALRHNLQTIDERLSNLSSSNSRLGQLRHLFFHQEIVNLERPAPESIINLWNQALINDSKHLTQLAA